MRLRSTVRQPQRLDSELLYQPVSQDSLRGPDSPRWMSSFPDNNPGLPPAAFPTLDMLRPFGDADHKECSARKTLLVESGIEELTRNRDDYSQIRPARRDRHHDIAVDYDCIPIDQFENEVASNGDLNPVYTKNMSIMANPGQESSYSKDMDDSDPEEVKQRNVSASRASQTPDPAWGDISPRLQVEIFDNIVQKRNWRNACSLLAMSPEDRINIEKYCMDRNEQMVLENAQLNDMREKQLRMLLRIDNSTLKLDGIPRHLAFRKLSRQYIRSLRESIHYDYLLCNAEEVLKARRFLSKRGLDWRNAGEWGDNIIVLRMSGDHAKSDSLEWNESSRPVSFCRTKQKQSRPNPHGFDASNDKSTGCNVATSNTIVSQTREATTNGRAGTINPAALLLRERDITTPPKTSEVTLKPEIDSGPHRIGLVRLKIGTEKAAQVRDYQEMSAFRFKQMSRFPHIPGPICTPSPQHMRRHRHSRRLGGDTTISPSLLDRRYYLPNPFSRPLGKTNGWHLSNNFLDPKSSRMSTPSMRCRQKLEKARLEAQRKKEEHESRCSKVATDIDWRRRAAFISMDPRPTATIPESLPSFSAYFERELPPSSSSVTRGSASKSIDGTFTVASNSDLPSDLTNHASDYGSRDTTPATIPHISSLSVCGDHGQPRIAMRHYRQTPESEYDGEFDEDEMVLVPTEKGPAIRPVTNPYYARRQ